MFKANRAQNHNALIFALVLNKYTKTKDVQLLMLQR